MTKSEQAQRLAFLSSYRAHLADLVRLQQHFERELQAAGVTGEELRAALATVNSQLTSRQDRAHNELNALLHTLAEEAAE
ncbi:hypothetical protein MRQ47_004480 [Salmonella enterica]|nr:hypothetical protein [Salmonella enterica]